ncbi:MAG: type II toxin-antitoxin system antitoxin SocA domain-containing protein [Pseudomonadales bacterium]
MHDGRGIANLVLDYCDENEIQLTNLSLQKILYFCHVWFLVSTGKPLIKHAFEAWEYGPVLPYLYRAFGNFSDAPLTTRVKQLDHKTGESFTAKSDIDEDGKKLLHKIVSFYTQLSANKLVELSHVTDGPWFKTWNHQSKINPGMQIENEVLLDFYSSMHRPYILH